jgi:hypothetical protein
MPEVIDAIVGNAVPPGCLIAIGLVGLVLTKLLQ